MRTIDKEKTSKRLTELRKDAEMKRVDLADLLDIAPTLIYKWESGKYAPSIYYLLKLGDIYKLNVEELIVTKEIE